MDISGKLFKEEHPEKIYETSLILLVFQLDISDKNTKEEHYLNKLEVVEHLDISQFDISEIDTKDLHPLNRYFILENEISFLIGSLFELCINVSLLNDLT